MILEMRSHSRIHKSKSNSNLESTNKGHQDENDVDGQASAGGGEEDRDRAEGGYEGGDADGEQQLDGKYGVDLADEGPPELRALQHHRVQRLRRPRLHIRFPVPHLHQNPQICQQLGFGI